MPLNFKTSFTIEAILKIYSHDKEQNLWRRSIARCFNKPLFLGKKKSKKGLPFKTAMSGMVIITLNSMKNFFMSLSAGRKKISASASNFPKMKTSS